MRGNTQRALVRMLREAGAAEVHVRIASPPVKWPCFYGIDFPSAAELIANAVDDEDEMLEAVRHAIGADTLGYISQEGLIAATEQSASRLCTACFDGAYPIELSSESVLGKNVIEHMLATAAREAVQAGPRSTRPLWLKTRYGAPSTALNGSLYRR
ncbi:putative amidophosphoribosyltransferase purF [Mycobacterium xenopi 3993]|nr:putative amidophosphoribosyltransferase purF [Mycobacterium xenopi 3993]